MEGNLVPLIPTLLREIKQVELLKKRGPFLPEDVRDITCLKPDEVIESIKEHKNRKRGKNELRRKS